MTQFPTISAGAVTQYPALIGYTQSVQVIEFLDGSEQRYVMQPTSLRAWRINLDQLREDELHQLEDFFANQQGMYSSFIFPDPISGSDVNNCRFADPQLITSYVDVNNCSAVCWVVETNA
jgi:hypothetical protein